MNENVHPNRRAEDHLTETGGDSNVAQKGRSTRDFFRKVKQPLIGLGLAGAATPLIRTDKEAGVTPQPEPQTAGASTNQEATAQGADLEESIATRIGEARVDSERDQIVTSAVERYEIEPQLAQEIYDAAVENGVEPRLAYGLVKTESSFKNKAVSHVGARGLTQVMPRTAKWLRPGTRAEDLYDRKLNLSLGFKYLNQLIDKYDGDVKLALTAYNRGPGTVDKVLKRGGNPDNGYAGKVLKG
jgi:hypothetical protein